MKAKRCGTCGTKKTTPASGNPYCRPCSRRSKAKWLGTKKGYALTLVANRLWGRKNRKALKAIARKRSLAAKRGHATRRRQASNA